jgi:3',5'-nucleoside bisphosphate phosphatase
MPLPTIRAVKPAPHLLNADLHCHSLVSDGTLSPQALASRAKAHGVELWALTDHDEVGGQGRAREAAHEIGLSWVSGVEISVTFAGSTVHIVGLGFDEHDAALVAGLGATRGGREERAREMAAGLAQAGIAGAFEGALKYVGNPELISRTHFARYLVEAGICADTQAVFRRYLVEGRPGFVPHRWASLADAVHWITRAGGVAVIAHPGRYKFSPNEEFALFSEFKAHGGAGVEVVTGSQYAADYAKYGAMALEFGLLASRGSDFHAPGESYADLGRLPGLPGNLSPVWEALASKALAP